MTGSRLSLAIVPNVGDPGRPPRLTHKEYGGYINAPPEEYADYSFSWGNSFQWVPIQEDVEAIEGLPFHTFAGRAYVLLCAREAYVLQPWAEKEQRKWKLEDVKVVKDDSGAPTIRIQFDENGSRLLHQLTQTNINNHLAICAGDEVQYISVIKSPAENGLLLSGDFTEPQANKLAEQLRSEGASDPRMEMYMQSMGGR